MNDVTLEALWSAALVILAVFGAISTIGKGIDTIKGWRRQPMQTVTENRKKLDTDKRRLDEHEKAIADLQEGQKYLCLGVQALLEHELHNGNSDEMQEASHNIRQWLAGR